MPVKRLILIASLFLAASIMAVMLAWELSPFNRVLAWALLKNNTPQTQEETLTLALRLVGHTNASNLPLVATELRKYDISATDEIITTQEQPVPFSTSRQIDENFLVDHNYRFPQGVDGVYQRNYHRLTINGIIASDYSVPGNIIKEPTNEIVYAGTKNEEHLLEEFNQKWAVFKDKLPKKDKTALLPLFSPEEMKNIDKLVEISDLSYRLDAKILYHINDTIEENADSVSIATITIKQSNCDVTGVIPILYLKESKTYVFDKVFATINSLCAKPQPASAGTNAIPLNCKNCWLAPVSKNYALPSWYAPQVVATGVTGGGFVTPETRDALQKMFADANAKGVGYIRVSSSYRSFAVQESLFNSYVNTEVKNGLSYARAIEKANTYSARPGQSEHQLGTTLDIMGCPAPCNLYSSANNTAYAYLKAHAHEFGFVISYPDGSQPYTGYTYEPWHIRYIGIERATELYNLGYLSKKGYYLYHYLVDRKLW